MGKPKKQKQVITPFHTRARARSFEGAGPLVEDHVGPGEFRDTSLTLLPSVPRVGASMAIQFRCTVKIVRGDIVTLKLAGFKGTHNMVFTLESQPHPDNLHFEDYFYAYWSGENAPKGGPGAQTITLQCRRTVEANALVIVGVPDTVHIVLPDKLAANSPKLKIEGLIKHAAGGKIPKAPIMTSSEIKKRPLDDDIAELDNLLKEYGAAAGLTEDEQQIALQVSTAEADHLWEAGQYVSDVKLGLTFRIDGNVFKAFGGEPESVARRIVANHAATRRAEAMPLHAELARNLQVKPGLIVCLEDILYSQLGSHYPELTRAAVLALRLYTCEPIDICRMLCIPTAPCIHREITSAVRIADGVLLDKWHHTILALCTCPSKLSSLAPEMIPVVYRGIKDVAADQVAYLQSLAGRRDAWYVFPNFTNCVMDVKYLDEGFSPPDNAVLFEIHGLVEGIEIGDIGQYPEDKEWLLPMFSSFSVVSVETLGPEKNSLTVVVLRMRGSLGGVWDNAFPEGLRKDFNQMIKEVKANTEGSDLRSLCLSKMVHCNGRLQQLKALHPTHLAHLQYLEKFADVHRASAARQVIDDGLIKWQQAPIDPPAPGTAVAWETIVKDKKLAYALESLFLKRTRAMKQLTLDGLTVDFNAFTYDNGKGAKRLRRLVGRHVSHPITIVSTLGPQTPPGGVPAAAAA